MTVFTVGHSARPIAVFLGLLAEHRIAALVDVRRFPGSRRHPQFSRDALATACGQAAIEYRHEPDLGGHREPRPDSPHTAWRDDAFRGYADHMDTAAFQQALARVADRAETHRLALCCAEADPSRCHRQLLSDALVARGVAVCHIVDRGIVRNHELNVRARLAPNGGIRYDHAAGIQATLPFTLDKDP